MERHTDSRTAELLDALTYAYEAGRARASSDTPLTPEDAARADVYGCKHFAHFAYLNGFIQGRQ
jgi:hypothetical protein